jgi:hypothetical protein
MSSISPIAAAESRKIRVEFDTPATNYGVSIHSVYGVGDSLWVISKVTKTGDIGGDAITRVFDEVTIDAAKDALVIHKVLGKDWNWGEDTKSLQYIKNVHDLEKQLKANHAKLVWKREKPKSKRDD